MGKKLYVGNLPFSIAEEDLNELFSQVGAVESARVIVDRETGRSKGFGFVEMATEEDADNAIARLNGAQIDGRALTVNEARPQEHTGGGNRGGFGGRYNNSRGGERRGYRSGDRGSQRPPRY